MKVTAIKHTDVRGKELNYIKLENGSQTLLINVGEKTYNSVKTMTEGALTEEEVKKDLEEMKQVEEVKPTLGDKLAKHEEKIKAKINGRQ